MTFDERVEKALEVEILAEGGLRSGAREHVGELIRAGFPDLYSEKPTHELVPVGLVNELRLWLQDMRG